MAYPESNNSGVKEVFMRQHLNRFIKKSISYSRNKASTTMPGSTSYQVIVKDKTYTIEFEHSSIHVNDASLQASLEPTGLNTFSLLLENASYDMHIHKEDSGSYVVSINGRTIPVEIKNKRALLLEQFGINDSEASQEQEVRAPMPGLVLDVLVQEGQQVEKGKGLLILEAMKMENEIKAPADGVIKKIHVQAGSAISKNDILIEL